LTPDRPTSHAFPDEPPRWARNVSGLAWAIVFYLLTFVLWQLVGWTLAGAFDDRLFRAAAPLLIANLLTSFVLPRPLGVSAGNGLGLGGRRPLHFLSAGLALTGIGGAAVLLLLEVFGEIRIAAAAGADASVQTLLETLAILALAAFGEELFFRGYGFQQLARAMTPTGAALFTGMGFGFLHGRNPEVSELAVANTVFFGILFGLCLVWSRSFWLPYGLHLGWNFALAILGAPISGLRIKGTALETVPVGSPLWDGGAYGPEGGLAAALFVALLTVAIWKFGREETGGKLIWEDDIPSPDIGD
jgi:membrane protease YdiL (CAAX protease family)